MTKPELNCHLGDAALRCAEMGYRVFPCIQGTKRPLTPHGFQDATTEQKQIEAWWNARPYANVAIAIDRQIVVDVDGEENPWLRDDPEKAQQLASGALCLTPRGGRHFYFKQPAGKSWGNSAGRLAPRVDTRGPGGYVLVPPSVVNGRPYRWAEGMDLDAPDRLPEPPLWLAELLDKLSGTIDGKRTPAPPIGVRIADHTRNVTLTSLAGSMRRRGASEEAILAALLAENSKRCDPPLPEDEVSRIAASVSRYSPQAEAGTPPPVLPTPMSIRQLLADFPELRPPVVHGLLRRGETMNIISAPKRGKSWLVTDLALAVATGQPWLGYETVAGNVLIVDNELHGETIANRIPKVGKARGIGLEDIADKVFVENLRGRLEDIFRMQDYFLALESGRFTLVILDAFYRFMPKASDENDNGTMANIYNAIDAYANHLGCCFVLIHHSTKGNQSGKAITDVGAGAGAQSRATDTHLILRPHEMDDVVVLEAAVRSWPSIQPRCLRWTFPIWTPADDLDPARLRPDRPRKPRSKPEKASAPQPEPWTVDRFVQQFIPKEPRTKKAIVASAKMSGISNRDAEGMLSLALESGTVHRWTGPANKPQGFATERQPEEKKP
jgi:hypothetical protein